MATVSNRPTETVENNSRPLASNFTGSTFASGFNNGFAVSPATGFFGFGQAPANFDTNFGTGFNTLVYTLNLGLGVV
jgi:hypothetical protein